MRCERGTSLDEMLAVSQNCHFTARPRTSDSVAVREAAFARGHAEDCEKVQMSSAKSEGEKRRGEWGWKEREGKLESWDE